MFQRMIRAARLDGTLYQELRDDPTATIQAFGVVMLIGSARALAEMAAVGGGLGFVGQLQIVTWGLSSALVGWVVLSLMAYYGGSRVLRKTLTFPLLLRTIGFASTPAMLYALGLLGGGFMLMLSPVIVLWVIVAMVFALRHTLQVSLLVGFWLSVVGFFIALSILQLLAMPFL